MGKPVLVKFYAILTLYSKFTIKENYMQKEHSFSLMDVNILLNSL